MIRVVSVKGLRTPEQRATVVYVGRAFAGWPASPFGNPYKPKMGSTFNAVAAFRAWLQRWEADRPDDFNAKLLSLWEATGRGALPLGCWCGSWSPDGPPQAEFCHAIVLAKLLQERFGGAE